MPIRDVVRDWIPPAALRVIRRIRGRPGPVEWEYCPEGWRTVDPRLTGWNAESVAETQKRLWPRFLEIVRGTGPMGLFHTEPEPTGLDILGQNNILAFGYALALTAHKKDRVSILDYGGGIGHYAVISRALFPDLQIDYTCREVPVLCQAGREVLPDDTFVETDEQCAGRTYDLVFCSGALQYFEKWAETVHLLAGLTGDVFYLARVPVVFTVPSFVVVQRPYAAGYATEYLGWFFNYDELVSTLRQSGLTLFREVLTHDANDLENAPELCRYRAFLCRRG